MRCSTLVTSLLVLAGTAAADETPPDPDNTANDPVPPVPTEDPPAPAPAPIVVSPPPMTYGDPPARDQRSMLERLGVGITAGGGVAGFTDSELRDTTGDGGDWDVRATFGTRSLLAFEASYLGSAQTIDSLGLDDSAILVGNGIQGNLRVNAMPDFVVQPFAFGGVAWRRYDLTNADTNTSAVNDSDDVIEFPVGVGVAYRYRGLLLDARGEVRFATEEDLVPNLAGESGAEKMHRYGINANIGYEF